MLESHVMMVIQTMLMHVPMHVKLLSVETILFNLVNHVIMVQIMVQYVPHEQVLLVPIVQ